MLDNIYASRAGIEAIYEHQTSKKKVRVKIKGMKKGTIKPRMKSVDNNI